MAESFLVYIMHLTTQEKYKFKGLILNTKYAILAINNNVNKYSVKPVMYMAL